MKDDFNWDKHAPALPMTRNDGRIFSMKKPSGYPDNNPKTAYGLTKVPLHLVPPSAKHFLAMGFADGAVKYGPYNWRDNAVSASVYVAALNRHMDAWWDGEEVAKDSGVEHLAHALACIAIIVDAMTSGNLIDDRPTKGAAARLQVDYVKKGDKIEREPEPETSAVPANITYTQQPTDSVVKSRLSCCEEDVLPPTERGRY